MKNFYVYIGFILFLVSSKNLLANCPTNLAPTNPQASGVCNKGYSMFTANINDLTNTLVWLDSANRIVGTGNNFQKYVDKPNLFFKVAEVGYDALTAKVGPSATQFTSTYPSQNFTNGQYFSCSTTVRIDSILLRSNNAVNGNIQIWTKAPENGGYILQKIPFNITTSGPKNTRVAIGAVLTTGNYFMNVEITNGSGILYRAIDGAVYPYTVSNLISITGTNFVGDPDRYYYFFDWDVSKMCMSPLSVSISPIITSTAADTIPYLNSLNTDLECDWTKTSTVLNAGWIYGSNLSLSSSHFNIPTDNGILASNDDTCNCDKSSVKLVSPWFDLRGTSKEQSPFFEITYVYKEQNSSKVYVSVFDKNSGFTILDSLTNNANWSIKKIDLRNFVFSDSVQFTIEHKDNGGNGSAVAVGGIYVSTNDSGLTYVNVDLLLDSYGSEISWIVKNKNTQEVIAANIPYVDINPYNLIDATKNKMIILKKKTEYTFKIMDSFGDGLDDGTNVGNYLLRGICNDTILMGSGALPYGGIVLPDMSWDSVDFIAGAGAKINIGPDIVLNFNDTLIIDAGPQWKSYQWSNGDTTRFLTLIGRNYLPGNYSISLAATTLNSLCVARDTLQLQILGNYNPTITIGVITDTKGTDIKWELRDKFTDTIVMSRGPFQDVIPYNINSATHVDTVNVEHAQLLEFRIIDLSGNGLNDGTNQGRAWISNNCKPIIFENESAIFPYPGISTRYDSVVFLSSVKPDFNLGADVVLCDGDSIVLNANSSSYEYIWSTGESSKEITLKSSDLTFGDNFFTVTNYQGVCNSSDTIKIKKEALPSTNYTTSQVGGKLTCIGVVTGQLAYHWDFGDGSTANTRAATHQYAANGNYTITYSITSMGGCINTQTFDINITGVGIENNKTTAISIVPNPSDGKFIIDVPNNVIKYVEVYDVQGRLLESIKNQNVSSNMRIHLNTVAAGIYFLKTFTNNTEIITRIALK